MMAYFPPSTYVVVYTRSKLKFFASAEDMIKIAQATSDKECVAFTDVDGEAGLVNGAEIEVIFMSTPETRENNKVFLKASDVGETAKWL